MALLQGLLMEPLLEHLLQQLLGGGQGGAFSPGHNPGFGGGGGCCGAGGVGAPEAMQRCVQDFVGGNGQRAHGAPGARAGGEAPPAGPTGNRRADYAAAWAGKQFKAGQTLRCADFVSTVLRNSGTAPPGFKHTMLAADFARYGRRVSKGQLQPGDIVLFGNTYRPGRYTHVGIYLGEGKFVHRPTAARPVAIDRLDSGYYAQKFTEGRRR